MTLVSELACQGLPALLRVKLCVRCMCTHSLSLLESFQHANTHTLTHAHFHTYHPCRTCRWH